VTAGAIPSALVLLLFVIATLLAWRNLQRSRADLHGARRVGAVIVVLYLVRWVGSGRHTPVLETELDLLGLGLSRALAIAVFVAILYLALEPYVRRRWPQSLVSWSRLLAGRVTDPMVARDVLIAEVSLFGAVMFATAVLIPILAGWLVPLPRELLPLLGMRQVIGGVAGAAMGAIQFGMICLLLLLLTHWIGRRRIGGLLFAAAMGVLLLSWWGAFTGGSLGAGAIPIVTFGTLYVFLLTRFGLLAAVVAMFGSVLGLVLPDAVSLSAWYAFCSWTLIGVHVAVAGYGLWFSVGKEPLVGWGGLDR
jgi:serine/threonine-protein kinase